MRCAELTTRWASGGLTREKVAELDQHNRLKNAADQLGKRFFSDYDNKKQGRAVDICLQWALNSHDHALPASQEGLEVRLLCAQGETFSKCNAHEWRYVVQDLNSGMRFKTMQLLQTGIPKSAALWMQIAFCKCATEHKSVYDIYGMGNGYLILIQVPICLSFLSLMLLIGNACFLVHFALCSVFPLVHKADLLDEQWCKKERGWTGGPTNCDMRLVMLFFVLTILLLFSVVTFNANLFYQATFY